MAQTFHICIEPPPDSYWDTVESMFRALANSGWTSGGAIALQGQRRRPRGRPREFVELDSRDQALIRKLTTFDSAELVFGKGARWVTLAVNVHRRGRVEIVSDVSFFEGVDPVLELKALFSVIDFPRDTLVIGGLEGVCDKSRSIGSRRVKRRLYWIDQIAPSELENPQEELGGARTVELTRIGATVVVLTSPTPYRQANAKLGWVSQPSRR